MKAIIRKEIYGRSPIDFTDKCYAVIGMRIVRIEYNIIGNLIWEKKGTRFWNTRLPQQNLQDWRASSIFFTTAVIGSSTYKGLSYPTT